MASKIIGSDLWPHTTTGCLKIYKTELACLLNLMLLCAILCTMFLRNLVLYIMHHQAAFQAVSNLYDLLAKRFQLRLVSVARLVSLSLKQPTCTPPSGNRSIRRCCVCRIVQCMSEAVSTGLPHMKVLYRETASGFAWEISRQIWPLAHGHAWRHLSEQWVWLTCSLGGREIKYQRRDIGKPIVLKLLQNGNFGLLTARVIA